MDSRGHGRGQSLELARAATKRAIAWKARMENARGSQPTLRSSKSHRDSSGNIRFPFARHARETSIPRFSDPITDRRRLDYTRILRFITENTCGTSIEYRVCGIED